MAAPRAPAILLSLLVSSGLLRASEARADEETPTEDATADATAAAAAAVAFPDERFGPRYVIEDVLVRGNRKTEKSIITAEVEALGLVQGTSVDASDPRVEAARYRLLALGYFLDVRLSVTRGANRGSAVLVVEVEERGTIVINELFPSTSAATTFWGGADLSETNFLGRGINLGGGFVWSTTPVVPGAHAGLGLRLRAVVPPIGGPYGLSLSATGLYNDGSEFYRVVGPADDANPNDFISSRVKRGGGVLGVGKDFRSRVHVGLDFRQEAVTAELPGGTPPPDVDFMVKDGSSRIGSVTAHADLDTRSDPILPRSGMRVALSLEAATNLLGSSYGFVKTVGEASFFLPMPRGHALGFHVFAGAIVGDPPFFDRFFVGDLNLLLPRRALGINFSTQPSRNLLGTSIAHHRYDQYAGRILVEYAIPIWRRRGFVYGGDAFIAAGLFGMASVDDFRPPGESGFHALPIDLTGDLGLRLDTYIGIFTISIANALSRTSF
jgi:outer membrane protein insertion porin family